MRTRPQAMMLAAVLVLGGPAAEAAKGGNRGGSGWLQQVVANAKAFFGGETLEQRRIRPSRTVLDGSRAGYGRVKLKRRFGITYTVKTRTHLYSSANDATAPPGATTTGRTQTKTTVIPLGPHTLVLGKEAGLKETLAIEAGGAGDEVSLHVSKGIDLFGRRGHLIGRARTRVDSATNGGQAAPVFCSETTTRTTIRGGSPKERQITRGETLIDVPPEIDAITGLQLAPGMRQRSSFKGVAKPLAPR